MVKYRCLQHWYQGWWLKSSAVHQLRCRFSIQEQSFSSNVWLESARCSDSISPGLTVTVITPYGDQVKIYKRALAQIKALKVVNVDNISIHTVETVQCLEFGYVFLDVVMDEKIVFLAFRNRVNVAMTRARCGMIVIAEVDQIGQARGPAVYLQMLKNYLRRIRVAKLIEVGSAYPTCKYLSPPPKNGSNKVSVLSGLSVFGTNSVWQHRSIH